MAEPTLQHVLAQVAALQAEVAALRRRRCARPLVPALLVVVLL